MTPLLTEHDPTCFTYCIITTKDYRATSSAPEIGPCYISRHERDEAKFTSVYSFINLINQASWAEVPHVGLCTLHANNRYTVLYSTYIPFCTHCGCLFQSQGFGDDYTAKINKEGQVEAAKLDQSLAQNQGKVVDWLLDLVSDIKPEVSIKFFS